MQRPTPRLLAFVWLVLLAACQTAPAVTTDNRPTTVASAPPVATSAPTVAPPATTAAPTTTPLAPRADTTPTPSVVVRRPLVVTNTLTLWAVATDVQSGTLRRLLGDAAQTAGVELRVATMSADGLYTAIVSNKLADLPPPDLVWGTQEDLGLLHRDGLLLPADDGQRDDAFIPATVAGATLAGKRWGTPVAASDALLLLYNRKLIARAPATTDELIARARELRRAGRAGIVAGWAEPRWLAAWLNGMGGALTDPADAPTLDTPQMISALNLLKELRASGPPAPSTYADGVRAFIGGDAALAVDGTWALAKYRRYSDTLDLGIAPLPVVPTTGRVAAPPLTGVYLLYGKQLAGDRLVQAKKLGAALVQPALQARIARELGALPALQAALADPAVQGDPALAAAAAQISGAQGLPATKGLRCAWEAVRAVLPAVLLGETAPPDAAKGMQARALACVAAQ